MHFTALGGRPGGGGQSAFLQKRLGKGQKYFDSGDYQMAKQGGRMGRGGQLTAPLLLTLVSMSISRPHPRAGPAHRRGAPHPRQCARQEEFNHPRWEEAVNFEFSRAWNLIRVILSPLDPVLEYCTVAGPNTGAPAGHPVGQPLPNPAMARLLWSL